MPTGTFTTRQPWTQGVDQLAATIGAMLDARNQAAMQEYQVKQQQQQAERQKLQDIASVWETTADPNMAGQFKAQAQKLGLMQPESMGYGATPQITTPAPAGQPQTVEQMTQDFIKRGYPMKVAQHLADKQLAAQKPTNVKPFDMNNPYDQFLAATRPIHGFDVTDPTGQGYANAVKWFGTPEAQALWQESSKKKDFKLGQNIPIILPGGKQVFAFMDSGDKTLKYYDYDGTLKQVKGQYTPMQSVLNPTDTQTLGVPYGTTKGEASQQGNMAIPMQKRGDLAAFDQSMNILADIENASKNVNTFSPGVGGLNRLYEGAKASAGATLQTNPDAKRLQSKAGELSNIIRAMGEKGTLAEGDVNRGLLLIPNVWDSKEVAQNKIGDLRKLFMQNKASVTNVLTKQFPAKATPSTPNEIQVGNFKVRVKQ